MRPGAGRTHSQTFVRLEKFGRPAGEAMRRAALRDRVEMADAGKSLGRIAWIIPGAAIGGTSRVPARIRRTGDEPQPEPPGGGEEQPRFPRYVRVLAVAYVLSFAVQPIGFLLLTGTATFLYGRRREIDGWVLGLGLGGGVLHGSVFRLPLVVPALGPQALAAGRPNVAAPASGGVIASRIPFPRTSACRSGTFASPCSRNATTPLRRP